MLFVIHVLDKDDGFAKRMEHYPAHKAYLADATKLGVTIVMSGPLMKDDGETPVGSHFVIEVPDRKTAENFHKNDPFYKAGVWAPATVTAFVKRQGK